MTKEKFKRALIFSGGGTRMMIYLGMFDAMEKLGIKPDVILATCGGAFTATVINGFASSAERKEFMKSKDYFNFVSKTQLTKEKKLWNIGLLTLKKVLNKKNAPFVENVLDRYLVDMNQDLAVDFSVLKNLTFSQQIPTIILGSEILFKPENYGENRGDRKLYQKVLFTDEETAERINPIEIQLSSSNFRKSAIEDVVKIETQFSMLDATRISIADMFYVAPFQFQNRYFAGGAIDLLPIEIAKHIADEVIIEKKKKYSIVEEAFVRAVLGYSGNERLQEIEKLKPDYQIDTNNIKEKLEGHYIKKSIHWKKMEVQLSLPTDYQKFRNDMEMQYQYGYEQTMRSMK